MMPYRIGTATDRNPARIKILLKRNHNNSQDNVNFNQDRKKMVVSASIFSSLCMGLVWVVTHIPL